MADQLLTLYSSLAQSEIDYMKNMAYQGSMILDIFLKKQAKANGVYGGLQHRELGKDSLLKLPTYDGYTRRIFTDGSVALDSTTVKDGLWAGMGDEVKTKQIDSAGVVGEVPPAHLNLAFTISRSRLMQIEELYKARRDSELQMAIGDSLIKPKADLKFGFAYGVMNGRGGSDPDYTNYTFTAPANVFDVSWATFGGTPTKRQIEGLYPFVLNGSGEVDYTGATAYTGVSKLYNISTTGDNAYWKPRVYDFFSGIYSGGTAWTNAPFGYTTLSGITAAGTSSKVKASYLKSSNVLNSATADCPAIIDIVTQVIGERSTNDQKPYVGTCVRPLYNLMIQAIRSKEWGTGIGGQEKVSDLVEMGYNDQIVIDGVAIIPDDTKRKMSDGTTITVHPADCIILWNLDSLVIEAHKDYNFVESEWVDQTNVGVIGRFVKQINATVRMVMPNREAQTIIKFAPINYSA
jgi:hypothetical protein